MSKEQAKRLKAIKRELEALVQELTPLVHLVPHDTVLAYDAGCLVVALRAIEETSEGL